MKNAKKLILLALCAVLLVGASVMGTLAYLQMQTKTATNTFTVGQVKISLQEYKIGEDGKKTDETINATDADATLENIKLIPGRVIEKHPFITVAANSEKCFLYVKVENNIAGVESAEVGYKNVAAQMAENGWTQLTGVDNVYYMEVETSNADQVKDIFVSFKVNPALGNQEIAAFADKTIEIAAYAIQYEGFTSAAEAWTAANFS